MEAKIGTAVVLLFGDLSVTGFERFGNELLNCSTGDKLFIATDTLS